MESFSSGYVCRFCTAKKSEIQEKEVSSDGFTLRTKEMHELHVRSAVETEKSCCGVKRQCVLSARLSHFNVSTGYPPDSAHDIFEGILPVELAHCLNVLISKGFLTLNSLNKNYPEILGPTKKTPSYCST